MKRSYVFLLIAFVMASLPNVAWTQGMLFPDYMEFNTLGGGARAAGMGGAYLGLSEGEYGFSWNPAGMIFAEKPGIGLQFASGADKFKRAHFTFFGNEFRSVDQIEIKREHFNLDFGGFVVPFSFFEREWAVGGGYRTVFDMEMKYDAPGNFGSKSTFTQINGVDAISIGVSGKITEGIGIGITGNSYIRGNEYNSILGQSGVFTYPSNPVPDTVDVWTNENSHYSGFNFDLGLGAQFGMFKGGLVIRTPYDLIQNSKATVQLMIPPTPAGVIDRVKTTTNMPLAYSLGLAISPIEKLTVAFDYDSRAMSNSELDIDFESSLYTDQVIDPEWQDLNQFRIGAEYVIGGGFADIPVRAGFRNMPSVERELLYNDATDVTYGDQISTNILAFGTGLQFDRAWIDLAYQFGSSSFTTTYNFTGTEQLIEKKRDYSRLFIAAGMNF